MPPRGDNAGLSIGVAPVRFAGRGRLSLPPTCRTPRLRGVLRQETDKLRQESDTLRRESRDAHDRIGERITQVRVGLGTEIGQLRDGQARLREGIGEIRGELKGARHSLETLRGDFRAHVFGRQD